MWKLAKLGLAVAALSSLAGCDWVDPAEPENPPVVCVTPSPQGCRADSDCSGGKVCRATPGCKPSSCTCLNGGWACTKDCGSNACVTP
jgi:Cys-rich repeat protein